MTARPSPRGCRTTATSWRAPSRRVRPQRAPRPQPLLAGGALRPTPLTPRSPRPRRQDVVTRYACATGFHCTRRFGWDCHGLPVEYEIDKALGIKSKDDVLAMGIDMYNEACRAIVMRYSKARRLSRAARASLGRRVGLTRLCSAALRAGVGDDCSARGALDRL